MYMDSNRIRTIRTLNDGSAFSPIPHFLLRAVIDATVLMEMNCELVGSVGTVPTYLLEEKSQVGYGRLSCIEKFCRM